MNLTTEFEPFSFNSYGAKIPIAELRGIDELAAEYYGLNLKSTSNPLFHTSTSGSFSTVSTPIFAGKYSFFRT